MKLAIFTANYNGSGPLDPYRSSLIDSFRNHGIDILLIQATDFFSDLESERVLPLAEQLIHHRLLRFKPHACLFFNAAGRTPRTLDLLERLSIPNLVWFWDHPGFHSPELLEQSKSSIFASANNTFSSWLQTMGVCSEPLFIPFPSLSGPVNQVTKSDWEQRPISLLFMGTIWDLDFFREKAADFLANSTFPGTMNEFMKLVDEDLTFVISGQSAIRKNRYLEDFKNTFRSLGEYLNHSSNYFSAIERVLILSDLDIKDTCLYGPVLGWKKAIKTTPQLDKYYKFRNVTDPTELVKICSSSKLGLNLFHRQNHQGGTNFRFIEYATSRTPILSNQNSVCNQIFPHGAAAFYFKNAAGLKELIRNLSNDPSLMIEATNRAYEIAKDNFEISKVISAITGALQIRLTKRRSGPRGTLVTFSRRNPVSRLMGIGLLTRKITNRLTKQGAKFRERNNKRRELQGRP